MTFVQRKYLTLCLLQLLCTVLFSNEIKYSNFSLKNKYDSTLNINLIKILDTVLYRDQFYREKETEISKRYGQGSKEVTELRNKIKQYDIINIAIIEKLIKEYGWINIEKTGKKGLSTVFLVIQHSNLSTQEKYLPTIKMAVSNGKIPSSDLALLEDRIALAQGKKQMYGSQVTMNNHGEFILSPVEDEINLNKRRAEVGLEPIEEYVKHWGMIYKMTNPNENALISKFSISLSLVIVTIFFSLLLFGLYFYKQYYWFWFLLAVCILKYTEFVMGYNSPYSQLKAFKGAWVIFVSVQIPIEYFLIFLSIFFIKKIFNIKHFIIDVCLIFLITLLYSYMINGYMQKIFLQDSSIFFFFNILEPIIYIVIFSIIVVVSNVIKKNKK